MSSFSSRYEKLSVLGEGAYGVAYLVSPRSAPRTRQVAKEIRVSHLTEKQKEGALAESKVLQMMRHSNIVAHVDTFMEGPRLYIVMEYADGGDLATRIKERKAGPNGEFIHFEERQVMFTFVQIALALQHIHSHNVLHRDLKPLNIFLTRAGIVKLGDFGIARVIDNSVGAQTTIGTPHYLSPEMCNSEPYGTKTDLWSLGVVTYELCALKVPFSGTSLPAVALQIIGSNPDSLPEWYSAYLSKIVFGLLEKTPSKRPSLERILNSSFVQTYIERNLSHTVNCGHGGLELLGVQDRTNKGGAKGVEQQRGEEGRRKLERQGSRHRDIDEGMAPVPTSPKDSPRAAGGRHVMRVASKDRAREAPRGRVLDNRYAQERAQEDARAAREREFRYNRQLAMETKMRAEQEYQAAGLANFGGGGGGRRQQDRQPDWDSDDRGERRKAEVKRQAQARRDEEEAHRKRELDRAMREAAEERRRLQQRMLAMQELSAAPFGDDEDPADATNMQQVPVAVVGHGTSWEAEDVDQQVREAPRMDRRSAEEEHLQALERARRDNFLEKARLREKFAAAVAAQEEVEGSTGTGEAADAGSIAKDATWVTKDITAEDREDDGRRHVEIVIPFTEKVRAKPKLSSEGRPPRRRSMGRSESVPADAGTATSPSSRATASPGPRAAQARTPQSRPRASFDDDMAKPKRPPRLPEAMRQQAAGSPARWLPKQAPPEEDTADAEGGDVCLLQDALANALRHGDAGPCDDTVVGQLSDTLGVES